MMHLLLAGAVSLALVMPAKDNGQWANQDPATREWFRNLHSPSGFPCCDFIDGTKIEDPDYVENADHSYDVHVGGEWLHVPIDKVVTATNRVGYAIFWGRPSQEMVYCFLPGSRG